MKDIVFLVVGWFAARGLDKILGKWLAMMMIAFQTKASKDALKIYNDQLDEWRATLPEKAKDWDEWRKKNKP